ncbi:MAG: ATP-binding cassette domain-containing protein, partial [Spirochaetota bacterium]|nr:ATP-binding cassette domain-containing protein [Spirochaetota bacterium]
MPQPILELRNIKKSFNDGKPILKGINLIVEKGDSLTIVGPGGCGKTVLLKIIAHIISPDSGDIFFYGRNTKDLSLKELEEFRRRTGMLFQNYALFDSLSIRENVGFFLDYHTRISKDEISERVTRHLKLVRLSNIEHL